MGKKICKCDAPVSTPMKMTKCLNCGGYFPTQSDNSKQGEKS